MQHLEFIDSDHFEYQYYRKWASGKLSYYIDFCWETNFEQLLTEQPEGFSDVLFPNIGYTYLINLGTPFITQLEKCSYEVKSDGFLPRHHYITCHHSTGNQLFGIKFKVCPVVFEKDVDFSEYKERIFPLAYLIDKAVVTQVKKATSFAERESIIFNYYSALIEKYEASLKYVAVVTGILKECTENNQYDFSIEGLADKYKISKRTLQRYFEATTSFSSKPALQTIRIRQAVKQLAETPKTFDYTSYGYYDYSHFTKHLKQFVGERYFKDFQLLYNSRKAAKPLVKI
jgi:AraC-like DNA-binding protein